MLLFWWFFGTFAGKTPAFVAVLAVLWNICGKIPGICSYVGVILEHLREFFLRRLRDDMLERSIARAKATRSGNSLKLEVRGTSNASFVASASQSARV